MMAPDLSDHVTQYRDHRLGLFSSHPHWLERGGRILRWGLVGLLTAVYLAVTYVWLRGSPPGMMIARLLDWSTGWGGTIVLAIAAFAFGMMFYGSFATRWAIARGQREDLSAGGHQGLGEINPVLLVLVVVAGFVLPMVLTLGSFLPAELRLLGPVVAFLPVCLLAYLLPRESSQARRFPWVSGVLLPLLLWFAVLVVDVAIWLAREIGPWFEGLLPELSTGAGWHRLLAALALGCTLVGVFRLAFWYLSPRQYGMRPEPLSVADPSPESDPLDWARQLATLHGLGTDALRVLQPDVRETVDFQPASRYARYFDGREPTQDQDRVMRDFMTLAQASVGPVRNGDASCGFDMLMEGPSGSGRSTTLDALALVSVLELGQRTAIMVPDESRVSLSLRRLEEKIERLGLRPFIVPGRLHPSWIQSDEHPAPDIVVTTAENWEAQLPGLMAPGPEERRRVRRAMCLYSTVLVDDWADHPMPVRLHLPFIIDKHRLLLESALMPSARVFTFARLSETGRGLVIDRLFGHSGMTDPARQAARLRYRKSLKAWSLDIESDAPAQTIDRIAEFISTNAGPAVLLRTGIDEHEAARQTEEYRTRFAGDRITVCYCHDQIDGIVGELSSIVMKAAEGPDAVFAMRSRRAEEYLVIVRVRGKAEIPSLTESTPLIIDRSGRGMAEAHLNNILRYIEPRVPILQRAWGQLGISPNPAASSVPKADRKEAGRLILDRPDDVPEIARRVRPYLQTLGAFVALDQPYLHFQTVDCHWIAEPRALPWLIGADGRFGPYALGLPEPAEGGRHKGNVLAWKGNDGAILGRSQLQYVDRLIFQRTQVFCIASRRPDGTGGLEALATRYRANGRDPVHPKFELGWKLPVIDHGGRAISVHIGFGGPRHGFMWTESEACAAGLEVGTALLELADDEGRPSHPGRFEFTYEASARLLLLAPSLTTFESPDRFEAALSQRLGCGERWGTGHAAFLPATTLALGRSLEHALPSSSALGKILVFKADGELARYARAIVWFVEPLGTGSTLSNAVYELFKTEGSFVALVDRMQRMLSGGWPDIWLEDRARFWLAHSKLPEVRPFERALLEQMLAQAGGVGMAEPPTGNDDPGETRSPELPLDQGASAAAGDDSVRSHDFRFRCPHCRATWVQTLENRNHSLTVPHCGQSVAMLVPGLGGRLLTPRALLTPWWPPGCERPQGGPEQQIRAVWRMIAERVDYRSDHQQFSGRSELWAPPEWVWSQGRGDCEDHSALMVSMLRELGVRSWLVWGLQGAEGHVWVQAEVDGREVLIEATMKGTLPDGLPTPAQAAVLSGSSYFPQSNGPARTDGETYDAWEAGRWVPVLMNDPEVLTRGEDADGR